MRVVIEVPDDKSGTGTYVRELIASLGRLPIAETGEKIEVIPACYKRLPKERYGQSLSRFLNSFRMVWWAQVALPRMCKRERADVLHCPAFVCPLWVPCPVVLMVFDLTHERYPETMDALWRNYLRLFFKPSIRKASRIVTTSDFSAREIEQYYPVTRGKVTVTYMGASAVYGPERDPGSTKRALERYGVTQPYFLYVGSLNPRKNIPGLVAGFEEFKRKSGLPHRLVLAGGKGWRLGDLEKALAPHVASGDAVVTGYVEPMPAFYHGAEALLMPSLYEGFGLPIVEAMACGCPVITSNCSSMPEVAGDAGLLADPNQPHEIAAAMRRVATDAQFRRAMVERGFRQAVQFSFDRMGAQTAQVYRELLAAKRNR